MNMARKARTGVAAGPPWGCSAGTRRTGTGYCAYLPPTGRAGPAPLPCSSSALLAPSAARRFLVRHCIIGTRVIVRHCILWTSFRENTGWLKDPRTGAAAGPPGGSVGSYATLRLAPLRRIALPYPTLVYLLGSATTAASAREGPKIQWRPMNGLASAATTAASVREGPVTSSRSAIVAYSFNVEDTYT